MRNFRKFQIWKKGIQLSKEIYQVTSSFPEKEKFGLISQLRRAAISIPSNIAEGCSRSSEKEFKRFLEIALGSAFELETQLIISLELSYLSQEHYGSLIEELTILQKQLNALIGKIGR